MSLQDKLNKLKYSLNSDILNLRNIQRQINEIQTFKEEQNYDYLKGLLCPEKNQGMRIPSQIPQPSSCFQLRSTLTLGVNAKGCHVFCFNPFFLYDDSVLGTTRSVNGRNWYISNYLSSFWSCASADLDGVNQQNFSFQTINVRQGLPSLYNTYRLVSASLTIKYIGPLESAQGVIGGGISYDYYDYIGGGFYIYNGMPYNPPAAPYLMSTNKFAMYTNFDNIRNLAYHSENNCLEGIRMLYFPTDTKADNFIKVFNASGITTASNGNFYWYIKATSDQCKPGFNWIGYIQHADADAKYQVDIACNFEAMPNAIYLNYLPVSTRPYFIPWKERKTILNEMKDQIIQKIN